MIASNGGKSKCEADSNNWVVKTFRAYLPQSLSDNILVSHKFQALQCHSKKGQGVRRRTHREKGKKSEHDTKARTRRLVRFPSASHTRQDIHTGPHEGVSQRRRCSSAEHSGSGWRARQKHWGELKDLFNGCHRRFRSGGRIDKINKTKNEEVVEEEEEEVRFYLLIMQQQQQKDESSSPLRTRSQLWWVGFLFPQWSAHPATPNSNN